MNRLLFLVIFHVLAFSAKAQIFSGEIYLRDQSNLYLNQVYVTNLNTQKTVLSNGIGQFRIDGKPGDIIRFTSIVTERRDVRLDEENLKVSTNLIELKIAYYDIQEVVIDRFKPSGNLRKDVIALKTNNKKMEIQKAIGLPEPKGDGSPPNLPVAALAGGGLTFSIDAIYDALSGAQKKKERLYAYEKMNIAVTGIKNYFGNKYFTDMKVPENLIDNFLQFVYSSDNILPFIESGNFEATKFYIEKYLPIYEKRLRNSNLTRYMSS